MRCFTWKLDFVSNILSIIVGVFTKHMNMTVASTNQLPTEKKSLFTELWLSWKKNFKPATFKQAYPTQNSLFLLVSRANFLEEK